MIQHKRNERTQYEYAISDPSGKVAFTIWFTSRKPGLNRIYRRVLACAESIKKYTGANDVIWNGDGTITAGTFTGKFTGKTLLQARGYNEASYR